MYYSQEQKPPEIIQIAWKIKLHEALAKKNYFTLFRSSFQTVFLNGALDFHTTPTNSTDKALTSGSKLSE